MINYYRVVENKLTTVESPMEDCWISLVNPTEAEVAAAGERYGIDMDAMKSALDNSG